MVNERLKPARRVCHDIDSDLFRTGCGISCRDGRAGCSCRASKNRRLSLPRSSNRRYSPFCFELRTRLVTRNRSSKLQARERLTRCLVSGFSLHALDQVFAQHAGRSMPVRRQVVPESRMVTRNWRSTRTVGGNGIVRLRNPLDSEAKKILTASDTEPNSRRGATGVGVLPRAAPVAASRHREDR